MSISFVPNPFKGGELDIVNKLNLFAPTVENVVISPSSGETIFASQDIVVTYTYNDEDGDPQRNSIITIRNNAGGDIITQATVSGFTGEATLTLPSSSSIVIYADVTVNDGVNTDSAQSTTYSVTGNLPTVSSPNFDGIPYVGTAIGFVGTFTSPIGATEGTSLYKVYQYNNITSSDGETLVFDDIINSQWTPASTGGDIRYVEFEYTPIDNLGAIGTPVRSSRVTLQPEQLTDPSTLANYVDHIDASDNSTYTIDGSNNVTAAGSSFTNNTTDAPVLVSSVQNGLDAIRFDGTSKLFSNSLYSSVSEVQVFAAFRVTGQTQRYSGLFILFQSNTNNRVNYVYDYNSNVTNQYRMISVNGGAAGLNVLPTLPLPDSARVFVANANESTMKLEVVSSGVNTLNHAAATGRQITGSVIGDRTTSSSPQQPLVGDLFEIIYLTGTQDATTTIRIKNYLSDKWGIAI